MNILEEAFEDERRIEKLELAADRTAAKSGKKLSEGPQSPKVAHQAFQPLNSLQQ